MGLLATLYRRPYGAWLALAARIGVALILADRRLHEMLATLLVAAPTSALAVILVALA